MVYGSAKIQVKVFLIVTEVKLIPSILVLALWRFLENFARETEGLDLLCPKYGNYKSETHHLVRVYFESEWIFTLLELMVTLVCI